MGNKQFSNVEAGVSWGVVLVEFIVLIVYIAVQGRALRRKIITMGRLIPTIPVVLVPGGLSNPMVHMAQPQGYSQGYPQEYPQRYPQYPPPQQAPPSGSHQYPQDYPPPYYSQEQKN